MLKAKKLQRPSSLAKSQPLNLTNKKHTDDIQSLTNQAQQLCSNNEDVSSADPFHLLLEQEVSHST